MDESTIRNASPIEQWAFFLLFADQCDPGKLRELLPSVDFQQAIMLPQQMSRSPWASPPVPAGSVEDDLGMSLKDTGSATFSAIDFVAVDGDSSGQLSQGTNGLSSASQDTLAPPPPPIISADAVEADGQLTRTACVAIALAIAIPVSLFIGGIIGFAESDS